MTTHKRPASTAGKLLGNSQTPKKVRAVAASDLAQAKPRFKLVFRPKKK